jgi:hypothetical protein
MLTIEDCIAFSDLTEEEILAIAEHEHLPETVAIELGAYLVHARDGVETIARIIQDDISQAKARGDLRHAAKLELVLRCFLERCAASAAQQSKTHPAAA